MKIVGKINVDDMILSYLVINIVFLNSFLFRLEVQMFVLNKIYFMYYMKSFLLQLDGLI